MAFTKPKVAALLELIDDAVNDDHIPWTAKRELINGVAEEHNHVVALAEFISWFEPADET